LDRPQPIADQSFGLRLEQLAASHSLQTAAGTPDVCAELEYYDIAVILKATYEWGGFQYTNASDAIAAAKRAGR